MALPQVRGLAYPNRKELKAIYTTALRQDADRKGIVINVGPGSEHDMRADALAKLVQIAIANGRIAKEAISILSATGDDLTELGQQVGIDRLIASKSSGYVIARVSGGATVNIPDGELWNAPSGAQFAVSGAHTGVANGDLILVQSVLAGSDQNVDAGVIGSWDSASIANLLSDATVDVDEIDGGLDDEGDEDYRLRILERMANPATGGNWSQVKTWAEESSNAVDKAYVYQSVRGPGSYDIALTGYGAGRVCNSNTVSYVASYVANKAPGPMDLNVTTVEPYYIDAVYALSLPTPTASGGTGGGWLDTSPYPSEAVLVTDWSVASGYVIVDANTAPSIGAHVSIWYASSASLKTYEVESTSGAASAIQITFKEGINETPLSGLILSPAAHNMESYIASIVSAVAAFGPGEKISSSAPAYVDLFPRSRRRPIESSRYPMRMTNNIVQSVMADADEIYDMDEANVYVTKSYVSSVSTPPVTDATSDPPNQFILENVGFYYQA